MDVASVLLSVLILCWKGLSGGHCLVLSAHITDSNWLKALRQQLWCSVWCRGFLSYTKRKNNFPSSGRDCSLKAVLEMTCHFTPATWSRSWKFFTLTLHISGQLCRFYYFWFPAAYFFLQSRVFARNLCFKICVNICLPHVCQTRLCNGLPFEGGVCLCNCSPLIIWGLLPRYEKLICIFG